MDTRKCFLSFILGALTSFIIIIMVVRVEFEEIERKLVEHSCIYYDDGRNVYVWYDDYMERKR